MRNISLLSVKFLLLSLLLSSCQEEQKLEKPKQLITKEMAITLNSNYISKRANIITEAIQKDDANAVWYSIEEIEKYIHYVKKQGKEKGYDVNGIRMYLGVYPETEEFGAKKGMTTIFLSPTGKKTKLEKGGFLTLQTTAKQEEENNDIEELEPLNYGSMGNPPKISYPLN